MFLYHFHSATGLALSLHTASDVDLCKGCNTDQCTPSQAGCSNSRSIRFYFLPKCSSSHLQPGALTCIESHDCVSFPQLDCNSANRLTAVSARNLTWIRGCKAHHSLQYRPVNTLRCPMQQLIKNIFGFFRSTAHPVCSQVH